MSRSLFSLEPVATTPIETPHRRIATSIPVPESLPILKTLEEVEAQSMHGQLPIVWDRAEGFQVADAWGNRWIDFTSTIFVANAGHGNPAIVAALREQLDKPLLHSYTYATKVRADYLRALIDLTPSYLEKAFLLSAGTEATECALKLMRLHGREKGKRRGVVITFEGNFHGRTMGAQMLTQNPGAKDWVGYQDPNILHLPFPYPWNDQAVADPAAFFRKSLQKLVAEHDLDPKQDLCGFMLESFQGWGAVFYPKAFVQAVAEFARDNGALLAFDEMQSGFGRTGELFGYMHYGVEPDLICCGKGISSSVALAAVLGRRDIMDLPPFGSMSSTNSANPLACAAGLANLKVLVEDGLIEQSKEVGDRVLQTGLRELQQRFPKHIRFVFGHGMVAALHYIDEAGKPLGPLCSVICEEALRRGLLLVHTGRESIKIGPPLCITEAAIREGIQVLAECTEFAIAQAAKA